jgi:hypothetical protein
VLTDCDLVLHVCGAKIAKRFYFYALISQNNGKMMCEFCRKVLSLHLPIKNLTPKYVLITGTPRDYDAKIGIKNELCK